MVCDITLSDSAAKEDVLLIFSEDFISPFLCINVLCFWYYAIDQIRNIMMVQFRSETHTRAYIHTHECAHGRKLLETEIFIKDRESLYI